MATFVRHFPVRPVRFRPDEVAPVHGALDSLLMGEMRPELRAELVEIKARLGGKTASAGKWSFFMMGIDEFDFMVNEIDRCVARPMLAMRLVSLCAKHIRRDTGEVLLDRAEIAGRLGVAADEVSRVASGLVRIGVLSRLGGRGSLVRYRLNERIATRASGELRDTVQAAAPPMGGVVDLAERRPRRRWSGAPVAVL